MNCLIIKIVERGALIRREWIGRKEKIKERKMDKILTIENHLPQKKNHILEQNFR